MTVRWKPLLVLSAVFACIAVVGFAAIAYTLMPRGPAQVLATARAERKAKKYDKSEIYYRQALQMEGRNPAIHEEMAALYNDWAAVAPADQRASLTSRRITSLIEAARFGRTLRAPRVSLLAAAMAHDEVADAIHWATDLLTLDPNDADAHYVLAAEPLEAASPVIPDVKRHLAALEKAKGRPVRIAWVKARLAQLANDADACEAALAQGRAITLGPDADAVDHSAMLRLRALDVERTTDPATLAERVKALQVEAQALVKADAVAPNRIVRSSLRLEKVQNALNLAAARAVPESRAAVTALSDAIDADVESLFGRALGPDKKTDLHVYLTYANHLRFRNKRARCQEVVAEALASPLAKLPASNDVVMGLRGVAVETALADTEDPKRFERAAPHIKALLSSTSPNYQGFGHLFQGAVELEQSGVVGAPIEGTRPVPNASRLDPKLRASALAHLQQAAAQLPNVVEAQARYGVALILSQEQNLGRQYLQNAIKLGNAEPQYQVWAAWSMVQAGYPEEAQPIVDHLTQEMAQGRVTRELEGTLSLLGGEIHQARRTPADLKKALADYERSYDGKTPPAAVQLRMAQIDVQLGQPDRALKRLDSLRAQDQGGTPLEHLAVLILLEQKKAEVARTTLARARQKYPDSEELVGLEAALLSYDKKPKDADRVLEAFLARNPDNVNVAITRAQVLSELLDDPKAAKTLLESVAERSDNSGPLVQLALLNIKGKDEPAAAATIARIRARWKNAAAADLLDAQLALQKNDLAASGTFLDAAIAKDPGNKLVQFWRAQLATRTGAPGVAARTFESLANDNTIKQLDSGVPIVDAANSALANLALESGDVDGAIRKFEGLRNGGNLSGLARADRWQLANAYATKGDWTTARKEIAALLNDPKNPPTNDERVRAANFYRLNKEMGPALSQLDYVLKVNPANASAVVTRAYLLAEDGKKPEAISLVRKGIVAAGKDAPPVFYLVLSALENASEPASDAPRRALDALDQGLAAWPTSLEVVQARYRLLNVVQGPKAAVAFVEQQAKADPKGNMTRMLAEVYRDQQNYEAAEGVLRDLATANPNDVPLAAALVRVTILQSIRAGERGDRDRERTTAEKAASLIRDGRKRFPAEPAFLQEECELAIRRGDLPRALAVTQEIDKAAPASTAGPLLRARIATAQNKPRDAVAAYQDALKRNPRLLDVRLMLGQASLKLGDFEEAARQARAARDLDPQRTESILLEARALALQPGIPSERASRQADAIARLRAALKAKPNFPAAYHQIAEIQLAQDQPEAAADTLKTGLAAVPDDSVGLAQCVEILASRGKPGTAPSPELDALVAPIVANDKTGSMTLAAAVGYHKADKLQPALALIEKAEAKLDTPVVHLNHGDILLSLSEQAKPDDAKPLVRRAIEQYDLVLKAQANSLEAINNKAWLLHSQLGESKQALEIAQAFLTRVDPSTLPGEFFDTLGAIQEAVGKPRDAEESYARGLALQPDHPVLNYHMGKLIVADARRAPRARDYFKKALAGRKRLTPPMAADLASLMSRMSAN